MKTLTLSISLLMLSFVLSCDSTNKKAQVSEQVIVELKGNITINGADALYPLMKRWAEEFSKDNADLKIEVLNGGTGKGLNDLLAGNCDLAMISRELDPSEEGQGLVCFRATKEGVIPIINDSNPYMDEILKKGMTREALIEIFTGDKYQSWGEVLGLDNKDSVIIFTRSDLSGAASVWAKYLGKKQEDLKGILVEYDENIINAVIQEPLSLSYCNAHYVLDLPKGKILKGIKILPIDFNVNGIADKNELFKTDICKLKRAVYLGTYPRCLCRYLYIVSKDKPENPVVIEFLKWIYSNGQAIAENSGFARLRNCDTEELIRFLNEPL
ncbi:MAG: substrate-binding domain-containing protein [Bacteroidales bacterium]|nr:substrate-binding domain-containing protein [Bacteroidales bacterium]